MTADREFLSFRIFRWTLGLGLLAMSIQTVIDAKYIGTAPGNLHAILVGGMEAIGAVAFLIPRSMRVGAFVLLFAILVAFVTHTTMRQIRWDLLIYIAAVLYVRARGVGGSTTGGAATS